MNTEHFKEKLEEEKTKLEGEMGALGRKNPTVPGDYEPVGSEQGEEPDMLDQAKGTQSFEENEGLLRDLELRYADVTAALARVESGSYGACETCGGAIEEERLEADPAAKTCTTCMA